jgi:hypothetical protein
VGLAVSCGLDEKAVSLQSIIPKRLFDLILSRNFVFEIQKRIVVGFAE